MDIREAPQAIAGKSFVINEHNELLIIKRRPNDVHAPEVWEVPGGRLEVGEDVIAGVQRETVEETGLQVSVHEPIGARSFVRDDGQFITMIIFRCTPLSYDIKLSEEHTEYAWKPMEEAQVLIHESFGPQFNVLNTYYTKVA